jgi:hypothetical protein
VGRPITASNSCTHQSEKQVYRGKTHCILGLIRDWTPEVAVTKYGVLIEDEAVSPPVTEGVIEVVV